MYACVRAKWLQSCLTLCNPRGCSPPGSSRREYRSWLSFLSPGGLPHPGGPRLLHLLHWQQGSLPPVPPRKPSHMYVLCGASLLSCLTLCNPMDCSPPGSSVHRDSPGKNTGMGCHALLQGISPAQGLNPGLRHCRRILYRLSHQGNPRILEWVANPFSRGIFPTQESNQHLLHCR